MKQEFTMGLSGGKLPQAYKTSIKVSVTFDPETDQKDILEYCFGGSSARVALQGQLRTQTTSYLDKLAITGLNTTLKEISDGKWRANAKPTPVEAYKAGLATMDTEAAILKVMADSGQPREKAERFVAKVKAEVRAQPVRPTIADALAAEMDDDEE